MSDKSKQYRQLVQECWDSRKEYRDCCSGGERDFAELQYIYSIYRANINKLLQGRNEK